MSSDNQLRADNARLKDENRVLLTANEDQAHTIQKYRYFIRLNNKIKNIYYSIKIWMI